MPYVTELPDGMITFDGDAYVIDTNSVSLINITSAEDAEFSLYDVDATSGTTLSNGDNLSLVDEDGGAVVSGTYVGDVTVSTASVDVGLPPLVGLQVTLNPLEAALMMDDEGRFYAISESGLDSSHLGVEITATVAGQSFTVIGADISSALSELASTVSSVPLVGGAAAALIEGAGNAVQGALDVAIITVEVDPEGALDLDDDQVVPCFLAGTMIATADGEVPVEDLAVGDSILTADGKTVSVKWIGVKTIKFRKAGIHHLPVLISKGALGKNTPNRDLYVSADHGIIIDDYVVNAGVMVNGDTIKDIQPDWLDRDIVYYHIETDQHDVIRANGTPAESFIDYVGRRMFDNYKSYVEMYPDSANIREMGFGRISTQRLLPEYLKEKLGVKDPSHGKSQAA
ncbi:Hint domain-containing protein [Paracoccus caeni]|uniref:Hint domain-containing protein n=1 Tax=Paracoccus caeni TaxID=657651 RepID=A0A934SGD9_9RHOB|nr:Hint domain-containing protein [Paracoccus caeni]MBK4214699.1 Hint domain-containing protein [Paracoccus caeni]